MCTRFVYNGNDTITGFDFDIALTDWEHKVITEKERFFIGIKGQDGVYHSYHGVNRNGNAATLLYVHGNERAAFRAGDDCVSIAALTGDYIKARLSLDDALDIVKTKTVTYAPDATMQSLLSDKHGRVLIVEPGIGCRMERGNFSLITNYSLLDPESTSKYVLPGDDRYERAKAMLARANAGFCVEDAFEVLYEVRMLGQWATRVSFVYSANQNKLYYVLNNEFSNVTEYSFSAQ